MELNNKQQDELRGDCDTDMPELSDKNDSDTDKPFSSGENKVSLSNGNFSVEMHCTNTTPEQVANISIWLLKQMKDDKQNKPEGYLQ